MEVIHLFLQVYCWLHHSTTHSQQHHLIIRYKDLDGEVKCVSVFDDDQTFALTVPPLVQGTRLLDSSRGLLCTINSFDKLSQTQTAVLWNPAIRRSVAVAVPNVVDPLKQFCSVVGFGVCPATMDPKLLKITCITDPSKIESISCIPFQVMVFTLSSGQWRCLSTNQLPCKSIEFKDEQTVIGQFIYLVGTDWSAFDGKGRSLIMSFDLNTHEFREVDIPNSLRHSHHMSVSRLRESLVLLDYDIILFPNPKEVCHIWMMDDGDSKAFTKLFTINPPNAYVSWTLGFRETGEPIIEWTHVETDGTFALAVYEPGLEDTKDLGIRGNLFSGSSYTESLLLLDYDDGQIIRC